MKKACKLLLIVGLIAVTASCAAPTPGDPAEAGETIGQAQQAAGAPVCVTIGRGLAGGAADALISTNSGKDGRVTANYGSSTALTAGGSPAGQRQGLLRFDLSPIPNGAIITSATATLHVLVGGGAPVRAHRVLAPWSEPTVTWASFAGAYAPAVDATFPGTSTASTNLSALVQGWVSGAIPNNGVLLERDLTGATVFASSEYAAAARPALKVCYVYVPPTCSDGVQNQGETGVDCGGPCAPCNLCLGVICAAIDACHAAGACNPATGVCSNPPAPNGTACDDGDACTQGDACKQGACAGAPLVIPWYIDADGDGYGDPASVVGACHAPAGTIATGGDCDDQNFTVHPGAMEVCDSHDNDCDGVLDDGMWSWRLIAGELTSAYVALDAAGDVLVAGGLGGPTDFGGGLLTPAGFSDVVVVKLDPAGHHLWSKRFGDAADQRATQVLVDAAGAVIVTGIFQGTIDFGGGPLSSPGTDTVFLAKLDASGQHVFSRKLGVPSDSNLDNVALDGAGNVIVTGAFAGSLDLGGGPLTSAGARDVFVAKLGPAGQHLWSKQLGDQVGAAALGVTVNPLGEVFLAANVGSLIDLGGGPVGGGPILAKLDAAGNYVWSETVWTLSSPVVLAPDPSGGVDAIASQSTSIAWDWGYGYVYFVNRFDASGNLVDSQPVWIANAPLVQLNSASPRASGGFVVSGQTVDRQVTAKIDVVGATTWISPSAINGAEDAAGNVVVASGMIAKIGVGACTTCANWFHDSDGDGYGATSAWVQACAQPAGYIGRGGDCNDASSAIHPGAAEICNGVDDDCDGHVDEGRATWSQSFGPHVTVSQGQAIAVDPAGRIVTAGNFTGTVDFGAGPLTSVGAGGDIYLLTKDAAGAVVQTKTFPITGSASGVSLGVDGAGNRFLTGTFHGTIDFGGGPLVSAAPYWSQYLAKLDIAGNHVWSRTFGDGPQGITLLADMAVNAVGDVVVTGDFSGVVDFGGGPVHSTDDGYDAFVARYNSQGQLVWIRNYVNAAMQSGRVAVDGAGKAIVTGYLRGTVDLGGATLTALDVNQNSTFVVALDALGNPLWSRVLDAGGHAPVPAVNGAGHVILAGNPNYITPIDLGGGPLSVPPGAAYLGELDGAGAHVWSRTFPLSRVTRVTLDASGDIFLAGLDPAVAPLTYASVVEVARLDPVGNPLFAHNFGASISNMSVVPVSLAADSGGDMLVSGAFFDANEVVADGQIASVGALSATLTKLAPACF